MILLQNGGGSHLAIPVVFLLDARRVLFSPRRVNCSYLALNGVTNIRALHSRRLYRGWCSSELQCYLQLLCIRQVRLVAEIVWQEKEWAEEAKLTLANK